MVNYALYIIHMERTGRYMDIILRYCNLLLNSVNKRLHMVNFYTYGLYSDIYCITVYQIITTYGKYFICMELIGIWILRCSKLLQYKRYIHTT